MKVVSRHEVTTEYVTTDHERNNKYQRIDGENWTMSAGNSWYSLNPDRSRTLELAYQAFLRQDETPPPV